MNASIVAALLALAVGCASTRPAAPPPENHVHETTKPETRLTTALGPVTQIALGFSSEEGDHCSVQLDPVRGVVATANHVWSGFQCDWKKGTRHYPVDEPMLTALKAALDGVGAWAEMSEAERMRGLGSRVYSSAGT